MNIEAGLRSFSPEQSDGLNYLEQLTAIAGDCCPHPKAPVLVAKDVKNKKALFMRAGCKLWTCTVCGARNGKRWIARMLHATNKIGGEWSFVTITAHAQWRGEKSLTNIKKNWPKLRKRLVREVGGDLYYLWVYERHKDHSWHVHMLVNKHLPSRWWKDNSVQCGMGYQCKSTALDNYGQAAGYIAKYLLKQMTMIDKYPKNMRRITTSRNFPQLPDRKEADNELEWRPLFSKEDAEVFAKYLKITGWKVEGIRTVVRLIDKYTNYD